MFSGGWNSEIETNYTEYYPDYVQSAMEKKEMIPSGCPIYQCIFPKYHCICPKYHCICPKYHCICPKYHCICLAQNTTVFSQNTSVFTQNTTVLAQNTTVFAQNTTAFAPKKLYFPKIPLYLPKINSRTSALIALALFQKNFALKKKNSCRFLSWLSFDGNCFSNQPLDTSHRQ